MERVTDFILLRTGESSPIEFNQSLWLTKTSELSDLVSDRSKDNMAKYNIIDEWLKLFSLKEKIVICQFMYNNLPHGVSYFGVPFLKSYCINRHIALNAWLSGYV